LAYFAITPLVYRGGGGAHCLMQAIRRERVA